MAAGKSSALLGVTLASLCLLRADGGGIIAASGRLAYPAAKTVDAADVYHGVRVPDPYRWLEDTSSDDTHQWLAAQEALTKQFVERASLRSALEARLTALTRYDSYSVPIKAAGRYFFSKVDAGRSLDSRTLYVQDRIAAEPSLLWHEKHALDPGAQIAFVSPSPDARYVAYGLSSHQSRWLRVRVVDVRAGADLPDTVDGLYSAVPRVSWTPDGSAFYYTRFDPARSNRSTATAGEPAVYRHRIGAAASDDRPLSGVPTSPATLLTHRVTDDGRYLVVTAREGGSTRNTIYYAALAADGPLQPVMPDADAAYTFLGSQGRRFWLYTNKSAKRGRVVAVDIGASSPRWTTIVPEKPEAIAALDQTGGGNALGLYGGRLVLNYLKDGRPIVRIFSLSGHLEREVPVPLSGFIWGGFSGRQDDPEVLYSYLGLTDPSTIYRLDVRTGRSSVFRRATIPFDRESIEVRQVFYRSRDGTRVPMFIAHKKGLAMNGANPAYMYGYGGMGWVSFIWYQPHLLEWLERGGVYAQPSIRGGGEYGEPWHEAGTKLQKQNAVDDYIAAAEWLVRERYTSASRFVANGGSLSGPLAATAALVQRRDLFAAAVIDRPVLDLIRFDKFPGGGYWGPEFGSPEQPDEFRALFANSPYHQMRPGECYPSTLIMSGDRDQTAVPAHAYKFTAALQAAQGCEHPILLKVMHGAGHNFGNTPEQVVDSFADELSFLFTVLNGSTGARP